MTKPHTSTFGALALLGAVGAAAGTARAADDARAGPGRVSAIETHSFTHAGEGSVGGRRVFRNGCYQSESRGGTGGGQAHDSDLGCTAAGVFKDMFAQADTLLTGGALVPEGPAPDGAGKGRRGGLADHDNDMQGARSVVIDTSGHRLVPRDAEAAKQLAAIVGREPSLDSWYVKPPKPAHGTGPQMIALSVQKSERRGERMLQASLIVDGTWWCHLSVPTGYEDPPEGFSHPAPRPLPPAKAAAILASALTGISARSLAADEAKDLPTGDSPILVEAAVGSGPRTHVRSATAAARAATSFGKEMRTQSSACVPP
jgi:hypothetical protein